MRICSNVFSACRYYLLNTTLPILMCGYLALLVFSINKASLEARIGAPVVHAALLQTQCETCWPP